EEPSLVSWTSMTDLTEFATAYQRTSFHDRQHVLYADLTLTNSGPFALEGPLYLGITNISHPSVQAFGASGFSNDGLAFFDFSHLVGPDGAFRPGEATEALTLSFYNPRRVPFTYDLVLVGQVNRPPSFTSVPNVSVAQDVTYQYTAKAHDPDGHPIRYHLTAAPVGMAIESSTGQIVWAPDSQSLPLGHHHVAVQADDGFGGLAQQSFVLAVHPPLANRPPQFRSIPVVTAAVGTDYAYQTQAFDPDGDTLTYGLDEAPAGMVIDQTTGLIQWTPTEDQQGQHTVLVVVSDGQFQVQQRYQLGVFPSAGNHPPTIVSRPVESVLAGTEYRYQVVAVDPDPEDSLRYELVDPVPDGLRIDPQTGLITWAAPLDQTPISVQVTDGRGGSDQQTLMLNVVAATPRTIRGHVFHDVDGNGQWDAGEPALPGRMVFLDRNGNDRRDLDEPWTVTDAAGQYELGDVLEGTYTVALQHVPGWLQTTPVGSASVVVDQPIVAGPDFGLTAHSQPNAAPYFTSSPPTEATVGVALHYTARAEDPDQDPLEYALVYGPEGMAIEPFSGQVVWTPTANEVGSVYAGIQVTDGRGGAALQTLALTVGAASLGPVFTSQPIRVARLGTAPYQYPAVAEDPDDPAASIRYWLDTASLLRGMTIDAHTGVVQWSDMQLGLWEVTVWAANQNDQLAYQWFPLQVTDQTVNQPPQVGPDVTMTIPAQVTWYDRVPAWDPDDDPLTYTLVDATGIPGLAMLSAPHTSWVTWTPTLDQVNDPDSPYEFSVQVSDGQGHLVQRAYRIDVVADVPRNRPPEITSSPRQLALVGQVYAYQATAIDPDGHAVHWRLDQQPPGMTIDDQTGLVLWAPNSADLGPQAVTVVAIDAFGAADRQPYTIAVSAQNRPPYFTTAPRTWATVDQPYVYHVGAADPDDQPLRFELAAGPQGAVIQPQIGLLTWTPESATEQGFSVRVVDPLGLDAIQNFTVDVQPLPPNQPPIIRNDPPHLALVGRSYAWQVDAVDPDHALAELTFSVATDPVVDCLSFADVPRNRLECDAIPAGIDQTWVTVTVTDPLGAAAQRRYLLTLRQNNPPLVSVADRTIIAGQTFAYDVPATDDDPDDVLAFTLTTTDGSSIPPGMTIDPQLGRIRWPDAIVGSYPLRVSVTDGIDTA
ncbi:MAG: hypothetical protein EA424_02160, partial [Planctomycetaceae bacterium]